MVTVVAYFFQGLKFVVIGCLVCRQYQKATLRVQQSIPFLTLGRQEGSGKTNLQHCPSISRVLLFHVLSGEEYRVTALELSEILLNFASTNLQFSILRGLNKVFFH